jgi:hypothetical protein
MLENMSSGTGNFLGGAVGALGSLAGAYMSYQQAKKDREMKKNMFNKENALNIQQLNMDLDRLAGIEAKLNGRTALEKNAVLQQNGLAAMAGQGLNAEQLQAYNQQLAQGGLALNSQLYDAINRGKDFVQTNNQSYAKIDPNQYKL